MKRDPFPYSNYPPGVTESTPDAPWNERSDAVCYRCRINKEICEMSEEEYQSLGDNGDGSFMCDKCAG